MIAIFGPVSSGAPDGGGPLSNWLLILGGGCGLVVLWRRYITRDQRIIVPFCNLLWITFVALVIIGFGIWGLIR